MIAATVGLATPASAGKYLIHLTGTLMSQESPGVDPNLYVGSVFSLDAQIRTENTFRIGAYRFAGLYGTPVSGDEFFRVTSGPLTWSSTDDFDDGDIFFTDDVDVDYSTKPTHNYLKYYLTPAIKFESGHVTGLALDLYPAGGGAPELASGGVGAGGREVTNLYEDGPVLTYLTEPWFSSSNALTITQFVGYSNDYVSPGFDGTWDFANSSVRYLPEPSSWVLAIIGVGLSGWRLRKPQRSDRLMRRATILRMRGFR